MASAKGQAECADILLAHGANIDAKDNCGLTAKDWAMKENNKRLD